jgi:hypothetical protein
MFVRVEVAAAEERGRSAGPVSIVLEDEDVPPDWCSYCGEFGCDHDTLIFARGAGASADRLGPR